MPFSFSLKNFSIQLLLVERGGTAIWPPENGFAPGGQLSACFAFHIIVFFAEKNKSVTKFGEKYNPIGLSQNKEIAHRGGNIAKNTRNDLEKELGNTIISSENNMNIKYLE